VALILHRLLVGASGSLLKWVKVVWH